MSGDGSAIPPLTDYFRVTSNRFLPPGSLSMRSAVSAAGMATDPAVEREKQQRKADARKSLPTIEPWSCSYKQRLLPSTQASLKKFVRECREYVKVDAICETAYLHHASVLGQDDARTARNSVLNFADKDELFPGTELHGGTVRMRTGASGLNAAAKAKYEYFCDANDTAVRVILGAVKDPAINNQLSDLADAHEAY